MRNLDLIKAMTSLAQHPQWGLPEKLTLIGSPNLYLIVRVAFVDQGSSLNKWCISNGVNRQTAERALRGVTTTRNAIALVERIVMEAMSDRRRNG